MDENQKRGHLIAILIMIIALLAASLISVLITQNLGKETKLYKETESNKENTNKKDETKKEENKTYEKIDDSKGYYYIQKGNKYELLPEVEDEENTIVSFSYPVINSKSATKINNEIKELYVEAEKDLLKKQEEGCTCVIINGKEKCMRLVYWLEHYVIETDTMLDLKIYNNSVNHCGSSGGAFVEGYFISKTTGKIVSNSEIIKSFNYDETKLIKAYNSYLQKLKNRHKNMFDEYKSIKDVNELKLVLFEEKNKTKLGVIGPGYANGWNFELEFDGNVIIGVDREEEDGVLKSD